jgi:DNA repair exonuclease SbcCD ATPase subunit
MAQQLNGRRRHAREHGAPAPFGANQNVLNFPQSAPNHLGSTALNLVYQAAELFSDIEERARETESRAQSLCKTAANRLRLSETRVEAAERTCREIITEAGCKLHDASKALKQAQTRIAAAEDQVTALEFRAQAAEGRLHEAKQALLLVEEAIRERLLAANPSTAGNRCAV